MLLDVVYFVFLVNLFNGILVIPLSYNWYTVTGLLVLFISVGGLTSLKLIYFYAAVLATT